MLEKNGRINDAEERMVDLTMRIRGLDWCHFRGRNDGRMSIWKRLILEENDGFEG